MDGKEEGRLIECVENLVEVVGELKGEVKELKGIVNTINVFKERVTGALMFIASSTVLFILGYVANGLMGK